MPGKMRELPPIRPNEIPTDEYREFRTALKNASRLTLLTTTAAKSCWRGSLFVRP
jgi:hypothetical protein